MHHPAVMICDRNLQCTIIVSIQLHFHRESAHPLQGANPQNRVKKRFRGLKTPFPTTPDRVFRVKKSPRLYRTPQGKRGLFFPACWVMVFFFLTPCPIGSSGGFATFVKHRNLSCASRPLLGSRNIGYDFNDSDFDMNENILAMYLDENPTEIPWDAIRYLIAEVIPDCLHLFAGQLPSVPKLLHYSTLVLDN